MRPHHTHLGTFTGTALERAGVGTRPAPTLLQDLAAGLAALIFCSAAGFILAMAIMPEMPV